MKYIVANWKQHKNEQEAVAWLHCLQGNKVLERDDVVVVIAAAFPLLPVMRETIDMLELPIGLAAQNSSSRPDGAFTGEVGMYQLQGLIQYVILGHSERRMYFSETNNDIAMKAGLAIECGITPLVCIADVANQDGTISDHTTQRPGEHVDEQVSTLRNVLTDPAFSSVVWVYEPVSAISTFGGVPLSGQEAEAAIGQIVQMIGSNSRIMYGGSVNSGNIAEYMQYDSISGVMPGGASLLCNDFTALLEKV